ncbi:hypothetical protein FRC18_001354 [Serendipita sp. 400]|nr:hypothetical protein FRC18_001354 [Serendipita sp. 400]
MPSFLSMKEGDHNHSSQCPCTCHLQFTNEDTFRTNSSANTNTTSNPFLPSNPSTAASTFTSPSQISVDVRLSQHGATTSHHPNAFPALGASLLTLDPLFEEVVVPFSFGERSGDGETNRNSGGRVGGKRRSLRQARHSATGGEPSPQSGYGPGLISGSVVIDSQRVMTDMAASTTTIAADATAIASTSTLVIRTRTSPSSRRVNKRSDLYKGRPQRKKGAKIDHQG